MYYNNINIHVWILVGHWRGSISPKFNEALSTMSIFYVETLPFSWKVIVFNSFFIYKRIKQCVYNVYRHGIIS